MSMNFTSLSAILGRKTAYVYFLISSYKTRTKAPPIPLRTLDHAPLKKALPPSSRAIFRQQSMVPEYMMSARRENTANHSFNFHHSAGEKPDL